LDQLYVTSRQRSEFDSVLDCIIFVKRPQSWVTRSMPDDTKPDEPVPFPVEVTVNGVKVTVTLMLKPGTTVVRERKPEPPKSATPPGTGNST